MRLCSLVSAAVLCAAMGAAPALAGGAPALAAANILQAGGAGARSANTGVTVSQENGVKIYRGRLALLGDDNVSDAPKRNADKIIIIREQPRLRTCRPVGRLRTSGFYSGQSNARGASQGFYSGQRSVRR